jgi:hypothetical protein
LQEVIYTKLGGEKDSNTPGIFSDITKRSKKWNNKIQVKQGFESRKEIQADLEAIFDKPFKILSSTKRDTSVPVEINYELGKVIIYEQHPIFPRSRATRNLLEKILIAYEYSNEFCGTQEKAREEFYSFLLRGKDE